MELGLEGHGGGGRADCLPPSQAERGTSPALKVTTVEEGCFGPTAHDIYERTELYWKEFIPCSCLLRSYLIHAFFEEPFLMFRVGAVS